MLRPTPSPSAEAPSARSKHKEIVAATPHDAHLKPWPVTLDKDGTRMVKVTPAILSELTCPICLYIMRDTVMVMECAHRFCSDCIQTSLRAGNYFCPACRVHIGSRRCLRSDGKFDALIQAIFPDLEEYEQEQEANMQIQNRDSSEAHLLDVEKMKRLSKGKRQVTAATNAYLQAREVATATTAAAEAAMAAEAAAAAAAAAAAVSEAPTKQMEKKRSRATSPVAAAPLPAAAAAVAAAAVGASKPRSTFAFILRRHPGETQLAPLVREALRTPPQCTIAHVKRWLGKKLDMAPEFEILVQTEDNHMVILEPSLTLATILQRFWPAKTDLVLHYRRGSGDTAPLPRTAAPLLPPPLRPVKKFRLAAAPAMNFSPTTALAAAVPFLKVEKEVPAVRELATAVWGTNAEADASAALAAAGTTAVMRPVLVQEGEAATVVERAPFRGDNEVPVAGVSSAAGGRSAAEARAAAAAAKAAVMRPVLVQGGDAAVAAPVKVDRDAAVMHQVEADRGLAIEAAMVRSLTRRKTTSHKQLMEDLTKILPSSTSYPKHVIRRKIEELIEKELIERDTEVTNLYHNLA